MQCESCGAELPQGRTTCEYCGSTWDRVIPATVVAASNGRGVFDSIKRSAAWVNRNSSIRQGSLPQMPLLASVAPVAFFVVFISIAGFIAFMALSMAGIFGAVGFSHGGPIGGGIALVPAFMALMPIGFVVLGTFMIRKHSRTMSVYQNSPTISHATIIAGKRTQVYGGGGNSSASTRYFLTAEFEDGRRKEYAVMMPDLYGRVSEGDAGILFIRGSYALDFDRVVVES